MLWRNRKAWVCYWVIWSPRGCSITLAMRLCQWINMDHGLESPAMSKGVAPAPQVGRQHTIFCNMLRPAQAGLIGRNGKSIGLKKDSLVDSGRIKHFWGCRWLEYDCWPETQKTGDVPVFFSPAHTGGRDSAESRTGWWFLFLSKAEQGIVT